MITENDVTTLMNYIEAAKKLIEAQDEVIQAKGKLIDVQHLQIELLKEIVATYKKVN